MLANIERLQKKMDAEGLDGLVAATHGNVYYLTGVSADAIRLFPGEGQAYAVITRDAPGDPIYISSTGESDQVMDGFAQRSLTYNKFYREGPFGGIALTDWEQRLYDISVPTTPAASPLDAILAALDQLKLSTGKVGVDALGLRLGYLQQLQEKLPAAKVVDATQTFRWIRKVKTPAEIQRLREVTWIVEQAIASAVAIAREGVTEAEMAREFDRSIVSQGGRAQFTLIRFGRNGVAGQIIPSRSRLQKGDQIWFDVGAYYNGYWADLARIFVLGEPTARMKEIYRALLLGEQAAIDQTRAGMTGGQVYDLTMAAARQAGLGHYRRHHVGHGIGAELYEMVGIAPGVDELIEDGTVVNIETPYYEFGLGALHVEDPFVVHPGGNELLTRSSRELVSI